MDSYLKELPSGDLQVGARPDELLQSEMVPEDNFLSWFLPSTFNDVTPLGMLVNFLLPTLVFFILLTLATPLIDKYLLGEEYEVDWSGRSGKYWDIIFGKGAKKYIGKAQFADGDSLRRGEIEPPKPVWEVEPGETEQGASGAGAEARTK